MKKGPKKLGLTVEKTIKKKLIDNQKKIDNQKTKKSKLGQVVLYENQCENVFQNDFEKMIFENQKNDLKKIENQKQKTLIDYGLEKIFFDLFLKNQLVNKKILKKDIEKQIFILSKSFLIDFDLLNNKNITEKNYEKKLLEKISNKMIIDYIKKNGDKNDKKDFYIVKNLVEKINQLKNQLKMIGYDKLDYYNTIIKNMKKQSNIKLSSGLGKSIRKQIKNDINFQSENYHKLYEKYFQKKLKSSKRLLKKYGFLIDDDFFVDSQSIVNQKQSINSQIAIYK